MTDIATTADVAKALGVSIPRVHALIAQKRIVGAKKIGRNRGMWLIPVDSEGKPNILPSSARTRAFDKIKL